MITSYGIPVVSWKDVILGQMCDLISPFGCSLKMFQLQGSLWRYWWCVNLAHHYSIHVPGWLQKLLNLITASGSVSSEPGSVTWLATKYLKTVTWRNHTEKLTTWWPQNTSFWPKIIPSSYFTILMLNCLENTLKLQFDSYVTAVRFLTWSISKQPQSDLTFQHCWKQSRF